MTESSFRHLAKIQNALVQGTYRYTKHAFKEMAAQSINRQEVEDAIMQGEAIEHYRDHKYGESCLLSGLTRDNRPLHVACSLGGIIYIITSYEPDQDEWEDDFKTRRKP